MGSQSWYLNHQVQAAAEPRVEQSMMSACAKLVKISVLTKTKDIGSPRGWGSPWEVILSP